MVTDKVFLDANGMTRDSFALARKILDSGFRPEVVIGLWRGGTPIAVAVQEFFHYAGLKSYHTALKTSAYTGIGTHGKPVIEGLIELRQHITRNDMRVLVVDDIFDSGDTIAAVKEQLGPWTTQLKFATLYYKPKRSKQSFAPDFYLRETDAWLVFPHEMVGLTREELFQKDPYICDLLPPEEPAAK